MNYKFAKKYVLLITCLVNITLIAVLLRLLNRESHPETYNYTIDNRHMRVWKQRLLKYPKIVSCHESRKGDNLGLLDPKTVAENSTFFIETSCLGDLSSRYACAVESAAKANPDRQIYVLFSSPVPRAALEEKAIINVLDESYDNIKFARVLIKDLVKETPLQSYVYKLDKKDLDERVGGILKFLTLYKFGGIYLSFDVIVAKQFDLCDSWFVKDTPKTFSSDMFAFSRNKVGKKLADTALRLLNDPDIPVTESWSFDTTSVVSHLVLLSLLGTNSTKCKDVGFQIYDPDKFYPLSFYERAAYFSLVEQNREIKKDVYTYHTFYRFTKNNILTPLSFYGKIARAFCPVTYMHYGRSFGSIKYPRNEEEGIL